MIALTHQVDNRPVFVAPLQMCNVELCQLSTVKLAAEENSENGLVAFTL
jgi:hypothetical protein